MTQTAEYPAVLKINWDKAEQLSTGGLMYECVVHVDGRYVLTSWESDRHLADSGLTKPKPPVEHRLLRVGELFQKGDEFYSNGRWHEMNPLAGGRPVIASCPYRRVIQ